MNSLNPDFLDALKLSTEQGATLRRIGEYKGKQELFERQTPEVLKTLKRVALVESSESSNRIEGIVAPHKRIQKLVLKATTPLNRSEQEIAGYRDVLNVVHESTKDIPLSTRVIQQFHHRLHRYLPAEGGHWKPVDNEIVERNDQGEIIRVRFKAGGRGAKSRRVRDAVERRVASFQISDIEKDCPGTSRDTIRKVLRKLRDQGVIVSDGVGRGARWRRVANGS